LLQAMGTPAKAGATTCDSALQARGMTQNSSLLQAMGTPAKAGATTCDSALQARGLEPVSRSTTNT
ncbi:MAG: hypothetical protein D6709_09720, partial [Chloroflexi bacterium]